MEEGYDEELEKLLGEIPKATSTPPHFEELQTVHSCLEEVSHAKDASSDEASLMESLSHQFTPFSETQQTAPPISTHVYEDHPHLSDPLAPFYKSLPRDININNIDMPKDHATFQAQHPVDFNLTYGGGVSQILPDYKAHHGQGAFSSANQERALTLQHEAHNYVEQGEVKKRNGSSGHLETSPHLNAMGAMTSDSGLSLLTSCMPSSLQPVDLFTHITSESMKNELHSELGKLALAQNGLALEERPMTQSYGIRYVHNEWSPLEMQGVRHLSEQSISLLEPALSTMTNAATIQHGSQHLMANGAFVLPRLSSFMPPYPSDMEVVYAHRIHEVAAAAAQQQIEERVLCQNRIKEEFLLRQQKLQEQQAQFYASLQCQPRPTFSRCFSGMRYNNEPHSSTCMVDALQQQPTSKAVLSGSITPERNILTAGMWASPIVLSGEAPEALDSCRYFLHGVCSRGDICPLSHSCLHNNNHSASNELILSEACSNLKGPRNGLIAPTVVMPTFKKKNQLANGHTPLSNDTHMSSPNHLSSISGGGTWKGMDPGTLQSVNMQHLVQQPPLPKYTTLKEVEGHIYGIAKDQHGCRFLQRKFEEGMSEDVQKIFVEIIDHVVELMTDPFGNYLVQKLLEVCDEAQRMEILHQVTGKDQLVTISLNMHGTRAVQKLIETLNSAEQIRLVVASLKLGVVMLIKDLNGNHVVQRCLQCLSMEDSQFIFDAAACHCVEIATHRHGCCVLQRCVDFSAGQQRSRLVAEIAANALVLSQDPFGNYVVQYILDLGLTWAVEEVVARLDGNYVHLAMQKFSSNVVEKCLKLSGEESKAQIIRELISSARLAQLLQDPFANYVVQSALVVSKGVLHFGLVEAIRPHLPSLRSSPYGKRILSRTNLKK